MARGRPGAGQLSMQFEEGATGVESVTRMPKLRPPRASEQKKLHTPEVFTQETEAQLRPWIDVESTRVSRIRYDEGNQHVQVVFARHGNAYVYEDVPPSVYDAFAASDSKGRYIHTVLDSYPYRPASPVEIARW